MEAAMPSKMRGIVRLTRWKEYVPFVIPVTLFGSLLGIQQGGGSPDWRIIATILANTLVVAYAFMINDIEDAPDDAREDARKARNPVASGELSIREGWIASVLVAVLTMALYALTGVWTLVIGALTLALSHFYSWKPVRLKAWAVADVISHSLMLSGLLFLVGYFAYDVTPGPAWFVALGLTLFSSYGQLYNQLRDFDMDQAAGLHNTAIVIGKRGAHLLMYVAVLGAAGSLLYALLSGVIPWWALIAPVAVVPLFYFFRPKTDMREGQAVDISGSAQIPALILANVTTLVWLAVIVLGLA